MTLHEAIVTLLDEFELPLFEDLIRDEAKYDASFTGLSTEHPRVQTFRSVCQTLRQYREEHEQEKALARVDGSRFANSPTGSTATTD